MTQRPRIGEILLLREMVELHALMQAIRGQPKDQRLISLLISRAVLDSDEGALALSEQTGFPAALQRHLERRHDSALDLIPADLAKRWVVLPIGQTKDGQLVVVARDPTPILAAALTHALKISVKLAVAPAIHIERLVRTVYNVDDQTPLPPASPSLADVGDATVDPHRHNRARTVSRMGHDFDSGQVRTVPPPSSLDATLQDIDAAFSVWAAERRLLGYTEERWRSALLVKIADGVALGRCGQGKRLGSVESIILPLTAPSLIQLAHDTRRTIVDSPTGMVQAQLAALLGDAISPVASPVLCRNSVQAVLVVGDPFTGHYRETVADLERLVDALGAAYERFARA